MPEPASPSVPPAFDPAADGWTAEPDIGFIALVGPIWQKRGGSGLGFGFLAEPRHVNTNGVVQGGMMMTFADRALGHLAHAAAGGAVATASFDMNFAGAGRIGSFIEMSGEVVRQTRSLIFLRGLLTCGGDVIGACQGTWKILGR